MKTLRLNHVARLAELTAGRQWSTIPLRGDTLRQALRSVDEPAAAIASVLKPLRVSPGKSMGDIVQQRQRLSQALSKAAVRNTGANAARHRALLKRAAVIRAVDDYVLPHANPLLGARRFREMQAVFSAPARFFAKVDPDAPKRMIQLRGPATKQPEQEGWLARNKWKIAGAGAMVAGIGALATMKDRGMKMPYNPHQTIGEEIVGIKSPAAKDYEAGMRAAAKKTARAAAKVETATVAAIQPGGAAAKAAPMKPATARQLTKPEVIKRATDKLWDHYKAGRISSTKVLRAYQRFWGAGATKGVALPDKLTARTGAVLRGRARQLAISKLKGNFGPVAPIARGQGSLALAVAARVPVVFFNEADPDQFNQFTPSLMAGTMYRKGRRALVAVKRSGNIAQDVADTAAGRPREPGRKKEWEKSWFKNAVAGAALGAGLWGAPRLYARAVTNRTRGSVRPGTTWGDMIGSVRRGEHRKLFGDFERLRMVHLGDWRLADMRGNSARVFSPKAKARDRREKTEWEKVSTIRKVRNGAIAAAVGLGGLSAYLGIQNTKLRRTRMATAPAAPAGAAIIQFPRSGTGSA